MTALVAFVVAVVVASSGGLRTARRLRYALDPPATPGADDRARRRGSRRGRQTPSPIPSPLLLELLAALLEAGAPPSTALRHLAGALAGVRDPRAAPLEALAADLEQGIVADRPGGSRHQTSGAHDRPRRRPPHLAAWGRLARAGEAAPGAGAVTDPALDILREAMRMSARAGLAPASLVRRAATEERRRSGAARRRAIRRLEVLLVLPVGLCLLPAFVLLGIVPVVIDLFGG